jgi:hypothetical protein
MPTPIEVRLKCLPAQEPVTTIRLAPGYSQSTISECWVVTGQNTQGTLVSVEAVKPYPADCIALPEQPQAAGLGLGLVLLAALARRPFALRAR